MDLFEKLRSNLGALGQYAEMAHGYYTFPKLEGELSSRMLFNGKERIMWSINSYLGLANHPEVREVDAQAAKDWGMAYPMGSRMMSGNTKYHEQLEQELAAFVGKEDSLLFNFGYQGISSSIDALLGRRDVAVYDAECHACIVDGLRMHLGKRIAFVHNDVASLEKQLKRATKIAGESGGSILVITEGVFGMRGEQGPIKEIVALKEKYNFRLMIDDAHGFGAMGKTGAGTHEEQGVIDGVDLYIATFAKSMAGVGGFIACDKDIVTYLRYNVRSQIFAKSLPMPMVIGALKRLDMIRTRPEFKEKLWENVRALQNGLKARGLDIGATNAPVTPVYLHGSLDEATKLVYDLRENYNIFCSVVMYPVIPKGMIILRLIPTAVHTLEEIELTLDAFEAVAHKLKTKVYANMEKEYADQK